MSFHNNTLLTIIKEKFYDKCDLRVTNLKWDTESIAYSACTFTLNERFVIYRTSKITPTKTGQFVTLWKRNPEGTTTPFNSTDFFDFIIITAIADKNIGQFIFPKAVLIEQGIVSKNGKGGKRGFRIYSPWDNVTSKQAAKTQEWQNTYFITIEKNGTSVLDSVKRLSQFFAEK